MKEKLAALCAAACLCCVSKEEAPQGVDLSEHAAHAAVQVAAMFPYPRSCDDLKEEIQSKALAFVEELYGDDGVLLHDKETTVTLRTKSAKNGAKKVILEFNQAHRGQTPAGVFSGEIATYCVEDED